MAMSGEQWLDQVFGPAVAAVSRVGPGTIPSEAMRLWGSRLAAQVEALGDTGVLTDEQERAALASLKQADLLPEVHTVSFSATSTGATAVAAVRTGSAPVAAPRAAGPPTPHGVLAGPRRVGELDGRPVTVISVELWSDRFLVDLCTDPGPDYRDQRMRNTREYVEWMRRQRHGHAAERPDTRPVISPLQSLTWKLHDEHGTAYMQSGGSAESADFLDRQRIWWSPAPPANTDHLTLLATDITGTVALDIDIPVPGRAS